MRQILEQYRGMRSFLVLWSGQLVSLLGGGMTRFAFVFYAYQTGGGATEVTMVALASFLPRMALSPSAGHVVDRIGDRASLLISEIGSGAAIFAAALAYFSGNLTLGFLYAAAAVAGFVEALQYPAFSAAVAALVRKDQLARADGLLGAARSGSDLAGPVLAGTLMAVGGLGIVFVVDALTSLVAVVTILRVAMPQRSPDSDPNDHVGFWQSSMFGVRWIAANDGLRQLAILFFVVNLVGVLGQVILQPMVLARTGGDPFALAMVLAAVGLGGITGGLAVSAWGGPRDKINGLLLGVVAVSVLGQIMLGLGSGIVIWCIAGFLNGAIVIVINSCNQVVWQVNVPKDLLGRVFGGFVFIAQMSVPLAIVVAGPLADFVLEPWVQSNSVATWLVGNGPGSGMSALLVLAGVLGTFTGFAGLAHPALRRLSSRTRDAVEAET